MRRYRKLIKERKKWLYKKENYPWVKVLKNFVDYVIEDTFESQEKYDYEFINVAKTICKSINTHSLNSEKTVFHFGNAQKLINMTLKYLYICTYKDDEKKKTSNFVIALWIL